MECSRCGTKAHRLNYVTELTKDKKVNRDTFARMSGHYSERDVRDRLARCQRTFLQYDQYRSEHPFGYALRHQLEEEVESPIAESGLHMTLRTVRGANRDDVR
jgi:hypothetical protein